MNGNENRKAISTRLYNLLFLINRLNHKIPEIDPRGLPVTIAETMTEIAALQRMAKEPSFLTIFKEVSASSTTTMKLTGQLTSQDAIAAFETLPQLRKYVLLLCCNCLPLFIVEEEGYIKELLKGKSKRRTKKNYLAGKVVQLHFVSTTLQEYLQQDEKLSEQLSGLQQLVKDYLSLFNSDTDAT